MYDSHLKIADSKSGKGVFTSIQIPANVPIAEALGPIFTDKNLPNPNDPSILQIGPNVYMTASGGMLPEFINHNCDPNCAFYVVGNRAILFSLYVIRAGTELTFDYSTTSTDTLDTWQMKCTCGSSKCRKVISGYQYLDASLQNSYKKKGAIPLFITFPVFQKV